MHEEGNGDGEAAERPPKVFYNIDSSRLSIREFCWGNPRPLMPLAALLGALFKTCRVRIPCSMDDPPLRDLGAFEVSTLSEEELAILKPVSEPLGALGFGEPLFHRIDDPLHSTRQLWMTCRHESGKAFARIHYRHWATSGKRRLFAVISTELADGSFLVTSSGPPDTLSPPSWRVERHVGASPEALWKTHQLLLLRHEAMVLEVDDQDQLRAALERQHAAARDFNLGRKVFTPLPDVAQLQMEEAEAATGVGEGSPALEEAAVLAEIRRLEGRKSGWVSLLVIAAASLGLFLVLGAGRQPVRFLVTLVLALLVHELGHFIAMKLFGYRNLRLFFIPFFGAAVSGQGNNVASWKRGVVILSGPLPGIALGVPLAVLGMAWDDAMLREVALLLLVLNGLNLLPFLPLDGGRLAHLTLFSRHPALDVLFRFSAVAGFVLLGVLLKDKVLGLIAVFMAFGIPASLKAAELVRRLRAQGMVDGRVAAEGAVPQLAALQIMRELPAVFPRGLTQRTKAQLTIQIFETLNSRPPSVLASLLLCFFAAAGFFFAVVFTFAVAISAHGGFRGDAPDAATLRLERRTYGALATVPRVDLGNSKAAKLRVDFGS